MISNSIQLPVDKLLKDYPKVRNKIFDVVKRSLIAFQKEAIGAEEIPPDASISEMDAEILEHASKSMLSLNPRMLYDIFDSVEVYIAVFKNEAGTWTYYNNKEMHSQAANTRLEAEAKAFEQAFKTAESLL